MPKINVDQNKHADSEPDPAEGYIVRKLNPRLNHIFEWAQSENQHDHIWDLCCDHGRLGLHLFLNRPVASQTIHLLDRVPSIISSLERIHHKLLQTQLQFKCLDACNLTIEKEQTVQSHLFIIAGVGGETIAKIIAALLNNNSGLFADDNAKVNLILSPNGQAFELRSYLRGSDFSLIDEAFITDNGRHHEHLYIKWGAPGPMQTSPISLVGTQIWHPLSCAKKEYLRKQMLHYKKCAKLKGEQQANIAFMAYSQLLPQ